MTTVTVILVAYNSRELLERPLSSVEASSCAHELEIVVVDNASSDGSAAFVRDRFPRVRVLEPGENLGFGRACNLAARESASDFILLLNPDGWVDPSCIDRLRQTLADKDDLGWAAPLLYYPDGSRQFVWGPTIGVFGEGMQRIRNRFERRTWVYESLPRVVRALGDPGWYSAACGMVRRQAWEEVGGFDPGFFMYFEDADLGLRLGRAGWRLTQVADAKAYHDKQSPSSSSSRMAHYRESQLRYYRKHRPSWENRVLLRKQTNGSRKIADEEMRARLLGVCEQAQLAFDSGVVDLPEGAPHPQRSGGSARKPARASGATR